MKIDTLALRLGWSTLRSRPTLTVLAILLLGLGTGLLGGVLATSRSLENLRSGFLSALTLEVELVDESEATRQQVMTLVENWPGVEQVRAVSKAELMSELQQETSEDLERLFGTNPFPSILRVKFSQTELSVLDSLEQTLQGKPGVAAIVFPRELWKSTSNLLARLHGDIGLFAAVIVLLAIGLVGLCLRAQVRNRAGTWELLSFMGMSDHSFGQALLIQELAIGTAGGLLACLLVASLSSLYSWLFLRDISFESWIFVTIFLTAIALALIAGLLTPRRRR